MRLSKKLDEHKNAEMLCKKEASLLFFETRWL
jgi:hypothetical protein